MEEFRKKLKNRSMILLLLCGFAPILFVTLWFITKGASDFAQGLSMGILTSIEFCSIVGLVEALVLLRDEKKLKEKYIASTDERNKAIEKETASKFLPVSTYAIGFAAVAAGFFDIRICMTLTAVLLFNLFVFLALKGYYMKKM
ncbi:MAG: hypothetical protein Q4A05_07400 [Ruminococcus sp.]|nr:hypothetical protein [Ruminococcus sp.]